MSSPKRASDPDARFKKAAQKKSQKMLAMRFERDYQQLLNGLNFNEQAEVNHDQFIVMMNEMGFTNYQG